MSTASRPSSLRTAVYGPSGGLQEQVRGVLFSTGTYLLYGLIFAVQVVYGFADVPVAVALISSGLVMNAVFYALVRSGRFIAGFDPGLRRTQLIAGIVYMMFGYAASGRSAAAVPIVMASHIVYAMFSMPPAHVWRLVAGSLLGLAATMGVCHWHWPDRFPADLQMVSFLYALLVVPLIAMLAHAVGAITQRLRVQQQELQAALSRLEALATRDDLTGTHNRRHMTELLGQRLDQQRRDGLPACIALLDIDLFKGINDEHGHAAGDEVLRRFARQTRESLRSADQLSRWGGEEFLVLLPGATVEQACAVLERVRCSVSQADLDDIVPGLRVGFSAGIASLGGGSSLEESLERADQAMYCAKTLGRGRTEVESGASPAPPDQERAPRALVQPVQLA
jgi:diguanylate cyclase (GGDEF)-like protein